MGYIAQGNFTFAGEHCLRDYGCWWICTQRPVVAAQEDPSITIAGMSGTLRLDDDDPVLLPMQITGKLCPASEPPNDMVAWQLWHRIGAWLKCGRRELVFDNDPDRRYMAEVIGQIDWDTSTWDEGELVITFILQPIAEAVYQQRAIATIHDAGQMQIELGGDRRTPINIDVLNSGTCDVTGVDVAIGERHVRFADMRMGAGSTLSIRMDVPIGAEIVTDSGERSNALPYAQSFPRLCGRGSVIASVTVTYVSPADGEVTVTLYGRGRYV